MRLGRRLLRGAGLMAPPLVAALVVGARLIPGGTLWPWHPGGMMDLEVYQRTGRLVLAGADFFHVAADQLPWSSPPCAAVVSVGWAWLPVDVAAAAWLAGCVLALALLLRRCGFHGWPLSAAATVCVLFVEPVRETLGFGQMGVFLVALACLDSLPRMRARFGRSKAGGPGGLSPASPTLPPVDASRRESGPGGRGGVSSPETVGRAVQRSGGTSGFRTVRVRRREGWLTGLATAVKLTPALLAVYEFFSGRRRVGVVAFCSFLVCTALGFALWQPSLYYWAALATGNSGVNDRIQFATNQTVMGVWTRLSGSPSAIALALSVALIVLGLVGAIRVGRRFPALGFCLAGLTSLLGSPVSWSHHYVWVVPLALALWDAPVAGGEAASPSGGGLADGSPRSAAWASPGGAG
ncbi:MAG: glycosyltransferase 87 family protein, partial [Propionibacteriaceae bacterium]|nr:glycosyltransferase 87 family protein [Propionibacteriaceae bacterium]